MIAALGCLYLIVMVFFVLAFLIDWLHSYAQIRKYLKYGIAVGVLLVGLELLALAAAPAAWASRSTFPVLRLCACGIDFLKMVGFTTLGMYYCLTLGRPSFPLLLRRHGVAEVPIVESPPPVAPEVAPSLGGVVEAKPNELSPDPAAAEVSPAVDANIVYPAPPEVVPREAIVSALVVALVGVIYSVVLFVLFSPRISENMRRAFDMGSMGSAPTVTVYIVLFLLLVALGEEIVFRLGVQSFLARYLRLSPNRYWIAIVATTILWTMGHAGALEPAWVKLVQIFPMGLMLGWLCQRYGVESSILAHMVFNVVLAFPSSDLVT